MRPNSQQQAIITASAEKPLLITAGAGTGKTSTLTDRFVHLINKDKLAPDRILLLTFTKKAAAEMKDRIVRKHKFSVLERENLWIHTFHSFCARLLRDEAPAFNLSVDFEPIDSGEQKLLYQEIYAQMNNLEGEFKDLSAKLSFFDISLYKNFSDESYKAIRHLRDHLITSEEYSKIAEQNKTGSPASYVLSKLISLLYDAYELKMEELGVKDFPKLIMDVVLGLNNNRSLREKYRKKFVYVMVDEFQDTSHGQFELLKYLCRSGFSNINAVGDPRQSIYQWRNADPRNLDWLKTEASNLSKKELIVNYRSYGEILKLAQVLLDTTYFKDMAPVEPKRNDYYKSPAIFCYEDKHNEAFFVASQIKHLIQDEGYKPDDIVVLFKKIKNRVKKFESAFTENNIPFYTSGSGSFFERDEILDLTAYLRLIDNPLDTNALVRILTCKPYSLSDSKLYNLKCASKLKSVNMFDCLAQDPFLLKLHKLIIDFSGLKNSVTILELFYLLMDRIELHKNLFSEINKTVNYRDSISKFINLISTFCARRPYASLSSFLQFFAQGTLETEDNEELEEIQAKNCVRLMTLYKAKGLEFAVVFLADTNAFAKERTLIKSQIPKQNSFFFDDNFSIASKNTEQYERIKDSKVIARENELRRLYYVGITRAKEQLYITGKNLESFKELLDLTEQNSWHEFTEIPEYLTEDSRQSFDKNKFMEDLSVIKQNIEKDNNAVQTVKKPLFLSCSILHQYSECPYRFYLKNILGVPEPVKKYNSQTGKLRWDLIGSIIHETIDIFHKNLRKIDLFHIADIKINNFRDFSISGSIIKEALTYYENTSYYSDDEKSYFSEYPFTLRLEKDGLPIELKGQIDRLYKTANQCRIIDFKTGSQSGLTQYRFQMLLYALACSKFFGITDIEVEIVYLTQKKVEKFKVAEKDLIVCEEELYETAKNIAQKNFVPLKSNKCGFCNYKKACGNSSKDILPDTFVNTQDYYTHFFDLIDLEEKECSVNSKDSLPVPIKYINFKYLTNHEDIMVNYELNNGFLRVRQGDFVNLEGNKISSAKAQVAYVAGNKIGFIVKGLRQWEKFFAFSEPADRLPFTRMKDNLFEFLNSSSPLKQSVLSGIVSSFEPNCDISPFMSAGLDSYQSQAVAQAVYVQDILLVQGPPGTGKTLTIAHMVKEFMRIGQRVLISAYTNRSVDAILRKLVAIVPENTKKDIVRVGRGKIVDESLSELVIEENLSVDRIAVLLNGKKVVALTAAGIRAELFDHKFDAAVIDEASQMPEPFALGIANNTAKLIMVGDDKQLEPIITNKQAAEGGLSLSLFERLDKIFTRKYPNNIIMLRNQYRMNSKLMRFSADTFYGSKLQAGTSEVDCRKYIEPFEMKMIFKNHLKTVMDPEKELVFVKVGQNKFFINCVASILTDGFLEIGFAVNKIGVISPYRHEVSSMRKKIGLPGLEIDTVDRFQGSDREIIILSCPCYNNELPELMKNPNRLNVALTRAKSKLIIIGKFPDSSTGNAVFDKFMDYINKTAEFVDYYNLNQ